MWVEIVDVQLREGYKLFLRFDDGSEGEVDIAEIVPFEGVFAPLRDPREFAKVYLDSDWGTICWPGDLDLAPEPLYERITGRNPSMVRSSRDGAESPRCPGAPGDSSHPSGR